MQARHAALSLAVAASRFILALGGDSQSKSEVVSAVNAFVERFFSTVKAPLKKTLLNKMSEAAKEHLGLLGTSAPKTTNQVRPRRWFGIDSPRYLLLLRADNALL